MKRSVTWKKYTTVKPERLQFVLTDINLPHWPLTKCCDLLDPKDLSLVWPMQYGKRNEVAATHRYTNVIKRLGHVTVEH